MNHKVCLSLIWNVDLKKAKWLGKNVFLIASHENTLKMCSTFKSLEFSNKFLFPNYLYSFVVSGILQCTHELEKFNFWVNKHNLWTQGFFKWFCKNY